ncbi:MAG: phosphoribosylanthranilate isomerase [Gammaproteobacteria bacterium]
MRTRIKFCGLTRKQDVQDAIKLGVDALGFVFVDKSPRNVEVDTAVELARDIPPFVIKVGLFMNSQVADIENVLKHVKPNLLQFHGDEDENFCKQFDMPYIKAVPMASTTSLETYCEQYQTATSFILDGHAEGQMGGSGEKFVWAKLPTSIKKPIILAGGLTISNVAEAIRVVRPYAVDVSSGIEAGKGIKDPAKMEQFIKEVHRD